MKQLSTMIPAIFNKIKPGSTFMSVIGYKNNYDEISDFSIVFHVNYENAVKKSLGILSSYQPRSQDEKTARFQLIESYKDTLKGYNPRATSVHAYMPIKDGNGNLIKGVKWCHTNHEIHLWGFVMHRVVKKEGFYPVRRSDSITLAKNRLRKLTPLSKFRQYKLVGGRFDRLAVQKLTLTQQDLIKQIIV